MLAFTFSLLRRDYQTSVVKWHKAAQGKGAGVPKVRTPASHQIIS